MHAHTHTCARIHIHTCIHTTSIVGIRHVHTQKHHHMPFHLLGDELTDRHTDTQTIGRARMPVGRELVLELCLQGSYKILLELHVIA